jgi:hypothetical protein
MLRLSLVSLLVWTAVVSADHYHDDGEQQQQQSVQHQLHFLAPHPLAGQVVASDDAMLAAMLGHYGKPPSGCLPDEAAFEISGVPGMVRNQHWTAGPMVTLTFWSGKLTHLSTNFCFRLFYYFYLYVVDTLSSHRSALQHAIRLVDAQAICPMVRPT